MSGRGGSEIPYEEQQDPRSNRMCGAACLAMVYRSFGSPAAEGAERKRKRRSDRRGERATVPGGKERRAGTRRTGELTQAEIWPFISKPNRSGQVSSSTHLMVAHARSYGLAAVAFQARHPLVALLACRKGGIRAILNHRLRLEGPAGHYSVLLDVDAESVVIHDPFYGPRRRISHAEFLELWQPRFAGSEIVGNVLIGVAERPPAAPRCALCRTPIPEAVACPRCAGPVALQPATLLGCVGATTCLGRMWNYVCCPACDNMFTFALAAPAPEVAVGSESDPWNLGPLFAELDRFRERVLAVPGAAHRADVKEQLELIEQNKEKLRLAEKEETALAREREAILAAEKKRQDEQRAAVEKAREEAAKPAPAPDGAALGEALLRELGITPR